MLQDSRQKTKNRNMKQKHFLKKLLLCHFIQLTFFCCFYAAFEVYNKSIYFSFKECMTGNAKKPFRKKENSERQIQHYFYGINIEAAGKQYKFIKNNCLSTWPQMLRL